MKKPPNIGVLGGLYSLRMSFCLGIPSVFTHRSPDKPSIVGKIGRRPRSFPRPVAGFAHPCILIHGGGEFVPPSEPKSPFVA